MNAAKFTLTSTVLAAALGLALGLTAVPAQADCGLGTKHTGNHPHCTKGDTGGEPALLTLTGVMVTETFDEVAGVLNVTLKQNSAKRLQFGNSNFGLPGIGLDFGASIVDDCVVVRPGDGSGPSIPELLNELNTGHVDAGSLIVRMDKKNLTGLIDIEYWILDPSDPLLGRVRVQTLCIGRCSTPAEVEVGSAMSLSLLKFAWQASLVDEAMLPS